MTALEILGAYLVDRLDRGAPDMTFVPMTGDKARTEAIMKERYGLWERTWIRPIVALMASGATPAEIVKQLELRRWRP